MSNGRLLRAHPSFKELVGKTIKARKLKGKDSGLTSQRVTLAMTRHSLMAAISKDIMDADLD